MKNILIACLIISISPLTVANSLRITPPGWSQSYQDGVIVLAAPAGNETITLSEHGGTSAGAIAAELFDANLRDRHRQRSPALTTIEDE